jgi:hypothetical protein
MRVFARSGSTSTARTAWSTFSREKARPTANGYRRISRGGAPRCLLLALNGHCSSRALACRESRGKRQNFRGWLGDGRSAGQMIMMPAAPLPPALPHQLHPESVGIISHFDGSHLPASQL